MNSKYVDQVTKHEGWSITCDGVIWCIELNADLQMHKGNINSFIKSIFFFIAITIWFLSSDVWYFDFGDIFFLKLRNFSVCTSMKYLMEISAFCSHKRKQCIYVINIYVNILNSSFPITPCLVKILLSVGSCYHFISRQMT